MKNVLFALFIAITLQAQAQIITATDLVAFAGSSEKAQKDSLLKRGYTIDPASGKELKYKAGMYGEEQVMTQPIRFFEVLAEKCSQNILTFDDGGVIFYTPDLARYEQLAKQFNELGFAATGQSSQYPGIDVTITTQTLQNMCGKQVTFHIITVKAKK